MNRHFVHGLQQATQNFTPAQQGLSETREVLSFHLSSATSDVQNLEQRARAKLPTSVVVNSVVAAFPARWLVFAQTRYEYSLDIISEEFETVQNLNALQKTQRGISCRLAAHQGGLLPFGILSTISVSRVEICGLKHIKAPKQTPSLKDELSNKQRDVGDCDRLPKANPISSSANLQLSGSSRSK